MASECKQSISLLFIVQTLFRCFDFTREGDVDDASDQLANCSILKCRMRSRSNVIASDQIILVDFNCKSNGVCRLLGRAHSLSLHTCCHMLIYGRNEQIEGNILRSHSIVWNNRKRNTHTTFSQWIAHTVTHRIHVSSEALDATNAVHWLYGWLDWRVSVKVIQWNTQLHL